MKTLQECKEEAAQKWFHDSHGISGDYRTLSNGVKVGNIKQRNLEQVCDEAAELYASQFKASEPIEKDFEKGTDIQAIEDYIYDSVEYYRSIVNPGIDEMLVEKIRHKYTIKIIKHHP
jgi:hypothetical protein